MQKWCEESLLPQMAATRGVERVGVYCAFNRDELTAVAQVADAAAVGDATVPPPPSGAALRLEVARLAYEKVQAGDGVSLDDPLLYSVRFVVPADWTDEFDRWYEQEHLPMIYECPYWSRSRRYRLVQAGSGGPTHLALHYLSDARGFDAPQLKAARTTSWRNRFLDQRWFTDVDKTIYFRRTMGPPDARGASPGVSP